MDALTNEPPLADRLALTYEDLAIDIRNGIAGVEAFPIESDEDATRARDLILPLKDLQGRVEAHRVEEKDYFLKGERTVDGFFKTLRAELDALVAAITAKATAYTTRKREEARKLEAAKARIASAVGDVAPVAAKPNETARVATATGIAVSAPVRWDHVVEDASLLPRDLLMPNEAAIRARRDGLKAQGIKIDDAKIPGVRIFEKVGATFR